MKTVWKFVLRVTDDQFIDMPRGAEVVHVAEQDGEVCLWAVVHTENPKEDRRFRIVGTGGPAPDLTSYLGTAHCKPFVWHVFGAVR
jgi:hypothetical protein